MRNKIFKGMFLAIILATASACTVLFVFFFLKLESLLGDSYNAGAVAAEIIAPTVLIFFLAGLIAFIVASAISKSIVKPINEIDPENPEDNHVYEELRPIVAKLASQNYKVARQMDTLRKRENEFNSITLNMNEGLVVINSRAQILSCNRSAKIVFGIKGEPPRTVLQLDSRPSFRAVIAAALSGSNGYDSIRKGDKFYSIFATPVLHENHIDGAVIVIIDVTEKEEREALRREFTSNISHELKTPLTSISGFAEIIKSGLSDKEETEHFAANIYKEASRLVSLVGDIIRLTQLDGGEIPYDDEDVNLFEIADEVAARLENIAERKGVKLSLEGCALAVRGNYTIIEEMVYNLCDNAIKYNREGGFVRISVFEDGGEHCVRVADNGIGIPQDKQDRVFERFYRVDKSHSKEIGGTGLGLSIVKHAAAYHKAKITLESAEGEGTTVTVRFCHKE